ncbi:MAG: hypothetical protein KatS3mg076_2957 [Candidatus Binatia bacterium]|nr:MAG: hypothetical protein KatS3mg076_2957 [Candidatus Binatia bacterium]
MSRSHPSGDSIRAAAAGWPPPPHDPRERAVLATVGSWEIRHHPPADPKHAYFAPRGFLHLQLWHPAAAGLHPHALASHPGPLRDFPHSRMEAPRSESRRRGPGPPLPAGPSAARPRPGPRPGEVVRGATRARKPPSRSDQAVSGGPPLNRGSTSPRKSRPAPDEIRCECGNLLARRTVRGIELKCRRCKRRSYVRGESEDRSCRDPPA